MIFIYNETKNNFLWHYWPIGCSIVHCSMIYLSLRFCTFFFFNSEPHIFTNGSLWIVWFPINSTIHTSYVTDIIFLKKNCFIYCGIKLHCHICHMFFKIPKALFINIFYNSLHCHTFYCPCLVMIFNSFANTCT